MKKAIWSFLNHKWFLITSLIVMTYLFGTNSDRYFGWTNPEVKKGSNIISDGSGYYAYLPQWFIYGPDDFRFIEKIREKYPDDRFTDNIPYDYNTKTGANKYYTGTALLLTPFFLIAHAIESGDGYSWTYQLMVSLGAIFYWLAGIIAIVLFFRSYGIERFWILLAVLAISFGTNVSYYILYHPSYSHIYSFAAIAWFVLAARKWSHTANRKWFFTLCLLTGLIFILRPTNVLIVLIIPFFFTSTREFLSTVRNLLLQKPLVFGTGVLLALLPLLFQICCVYLQSGKFALNTYESEGFDYLLDPQIMNVLFSARKGFFIYAPVLILSVIGMVVLFRRDRRLFWGILLFFAVFTYITSSWWCWWYGGALGMRPFADMMPVFVIPIAFLFRYSSAWARIPWILFLITGLRMYQVFEYQMVHNILHYDDMSWKQFREVFMKTDLRYAWYLHLEYDSFPGKKPIPTGSSEFLQESVKKVYGKEVSLSNGNYDDDLNVVFTVAEKDRESYFGALVKGEFRLVTPTTNPCLHTMYFKNGDTIRDDRFFIGPRIPEVNVYHAVSLEIYPRMKGKDFDSIKVELDEGNNLLYARNLKLYTYRFD